MRGAGHWLRVRLVGDPARSNADATGARVTAVVGGLRQIRERDGGVGYAGQSDPRLHFGLGRAERVEMLEVRWPDGGVQILEESARRPGGHGAPGPGRLCGACAGPGGAAARGRRSERASRRASSGPRGAGTPARRDGGRAAARPRAPRPGPCVSPACRGARRVRSGDRLLPRAVRKRCAGRRGAGARGGLHRQAPRLRRPRRDRVQGHARAPVARRPRRAAGPRRGVVDRALRARDESPALATRAAPFERRGRRLRALPGDPVRSPARGAITSAPTCCSGTRMRRMVVRRGPAGLARRPGGVPRFADAGRPSGHRG